MGELEFQDQVQSQTRGYKGSPPSAHLIELSNSTERIHLLPANTENVPPCRQDLSLHIS